MPALKINGQKKDFEDNRFPENLSKLLAQMKISEETVVAEVDGIIIERRNFNKTKLNPETNIELIRFVGGG